MMDDTLEFDYAEMLHHISVVVSDGKFLLNFRFTFAFIFIFVES